MKFSIKICLMLSAIFLFSNVFAAPQQAVTKPIMLPAEKVIDNLTQDLKAIQAKTNLPVIFSKEIPVPTSDQKYYLSSDPTLNNNTQYMLSVDMTSTCNGMKGCSIGSLVVRVGGQVGLNDTGSKLTQKIKLANGQTAYYTPAHAEADYWPTTLEWKTGNVAYYLSWTMNQASWDQKNIIINLANSALRK